jgi:hypothetical protein
VNQGIPKKVEFIDQQHGLLESSETIYDKTHYHFPIPVIKENNAIEVIGEPMSKQVSCNLIVRQPCNECSSIN